MRLGTYGIFSGNSPRVTTKESKPWVEILGHNTIIQHALQRTILAEIVWLEGVSNGIRRLQSQKVLVRKDESCFQV